MLVLYFQRGFLLYLFFGVVQYLVRGYNAGIRVFYCTNTKFLFIN